MIQDFFFEFSKRFIRIAHRQYTELYGPLARLLYPLIKLPPTKVNLLITTKCNMKCGFCYVGKNLNKNESDRLAIDEWKKIISTIPKATAVCLTGGEPFLFHDIWPVLELLLKSGHYVSIVSNGSRLTDEQLEFLVDHRLFYLQYSVHGLSDFHNAIPGHRKSFETIEDNIRRLEAIKARKGKKHPIVGVKTVIANDNLDEIPKLIEYCDQNSAIHHLYFNLMSEGSLHVAFEIIDDLKDPRLQESHVYHYDADKREAIKTLIAGIHKTRQDLRIDIGFTDTFSSLDDFRDYIDRPESFGVKNCLKPWHEISLYYNGMVGPCVGYNVGNVRDVGYNIKRVIGMPRYRDFLRFHTGNMPNPNMCNACKEAVLVKRNNG